MKQLVLSAKTGDLKVVDVPSPTLRRGHLLVRTRASLVSAGTERLAVGFAKRSLVAKAKARPDLARQTLAKLNRDGIAATADAIRARLDEPLPLGYSAAGEVVAVGAGLGGRFRPGQRLAVAGAGIANHAELNLVPENLAAAVPSGVAFEAACYATVGAIALHAVRQSRSEFGGWCAVVGVGLVGQLAAQFLTLSGVRVLALDFDADRLALANRLGADASCDLGSQDAAAVAAAATGSLGCDAVIVAAATRSSLPFETAAQVARDRAVVVVVGNTGTAFPYREFMAKELSLVVSRSYGPGRYDEDYETHGAIYPPGYVRWTETANLAAVLDAMRPDRRSRLEPAVLTTHRFPFEAAPSAYAMIAGEREPHLGVVLQYGGETSTTAPNEQAQVLRRGGGPAPDPAPAHRRRSGPCRLGVIGGGAYARTVLLPILAKLPDCELHTLATARGISASHTRRRLGVGRATANAEEIFEDEDVDAVIVATPHSLHATQAAQALAAGKPVLVEKPLALTLSELSAVAAAAEASNAFALVGFNRRFAPLAQAAAAHLAALPGSRHVLLRVNAGPLPADSWQRRQDEGGGRLLGEACHFIDLGAFLGGAPIAAVQAQAVPTADLCEDATIVLELDNGNVATIFYTALGDPAASKELVEAYAGGGLVRIEDFRRLTLASHGRSRHARQRQDKGHAAQLRAFVAAVIAGGPAPVPWPEQVNASAATLAAVESLAAGTRLPVRAPFGAAP